MASINDNMDLPLLRAAQEINLTLLQRAAQETIESANVTNDDTDVSIHTAATQKRPRDVMSRVSDGVWKVLHVRDDCFWLQKKGESKTEMLYWSSIESKDSNEKPDNKFQSRILPIKAFTNFDPVPFLPKETKDNSGLIAGCLATFGCIKAILNHTPRYTSKHEWDSILANLCIGIVKETSDYGTTSVSQGVLASQVSLEDQFREYVMLNCGTGGMRSQVGVRNPVSKIMPQPKGGDDQPNIHLVALGSYQPVGGGDQWDQERAKLLQMAKKILQDAEARGNLKRPLEVITFITGTSREYYHSLHTQEEQFCMDQAVAKFFSFEELNGQIEFVSYGPETMFLTQEEEGYFEQRAAEDMYKNLNDAGFIDNYDVFDCFGVGNGSFQFGSVLGDFGMKQPASLAAIVSSRFTASMNDFEQRLIAEDPKKPRLIALKSGAVMLFDRIPALPAALLENLAVIESRTKAADVIILKKLPLFNQ